MAKQLVNRCSCFGMASPSLGTTWAKPCKCCQRPGTPDFMPSSQPETTMLFRWEPSSQFWGGEVGVSGVYQLHLAVGTEPSYTKGVSADPSSPGLHHEAFRFCRRCLLPKVPPLPLPYVRLACSGDKLDPGVGGARWRCCLSLLDCWTAGRALCSCRAPASCPMPPRVPVAYRAGVPQPHAALAHHKTPHTSRP